MWKRVQPFIKEMGIILFVLIVLFIAFMYTSLFEKGSKLHLLISFSFIIMLLVFFVYRRIIRCGMLAVLDFILNTTLILEAEFIKQVPYYASVFTEKRNREYAVYREQRYNIIVKNEGGIYDLVSSEPVELIVQHPYSFVIAKYSGILLDIIEE